MWLHQVTVDKNVRKYISPNLCLTPEIKSKYFRIGECVGIGQTTVLGQKCMHRQSESKQESESKPPFLRTLSFKVLLDTSAIFA